ncbi:sigma 54-interacting transcriptional regulator [Sphingomonas sp. BGYR3]|uniref:sigma-54 interaction domain-containing protein n=1 Tax=Sphingomonas sp. BGYR3 TaxID=2975483 RepID=UPI0021A7C61D|nr:sigma 54-interacting transcriptional regulator [Sphingomonas sp. BGYR3]MDG5488294.1 sigma 54-interacting transcriptional regulator [Sphingomonas sp. BGYR3]
MTVIHATPAVLQSKFTLVSQLRAQGFVLAKAGDRNSAGAMHLVLEGETPAVPARTLILGDGPLEARPFHDGQSALLRFTAEDGALAQGYAAALLKGGMAPVAADPESLALFALAERVAGADITVLINGPTGTGKEVMARTIHNRSARRDGPFIAINCAALPETMLEAMLFGHVKGSFTGASSGGEGFFRAANGGTLLLDEIAEMPIGLQAKLLRALQEREVVPIGATAAEPIDVRVIACANRDLQAEVAEGRFRADLYYRLSVFPLSTRALADRPGDIAALAAAMVVRHASTRQMLPAISADALDLLVRHDWPGNARELENVIQRALLLATLDRIEAGDIIFDRPMVQQSARVAAPAPVAAPVPAAIPTDGAVPLSNIVQMSEFQAIRETLKACGGSRIETARRLGISERTLRYRLARLREQGDDSAQAVSA